MCEIDSASGLCTGCGRTLDEIARWGSMSDAERARIMAELKSRFGNRNDVPRAPIRAFD